MKQFAVILMCIALGACSKKVKELVSPPDDVSDGQSSSLHIDGSSESSSQSSLVAPPLSSQGVQSSMAVVGSSSSQASSATGDQTDASSSVDIGLGGGSSSEASTPANSSSSSAAASSSSTASFSSMPAASSSQAASVSSESTSSDSAVASPHGEDLFMAMCNDCHNLAEQAPFQIGNNLSLAELTETIESTMPFRNFEACTGSCADDVAYYISEMLGGQ